LSDRLPRSRFEPRIAEFAIADEALDVHQRRRIRPSADLPVLPPISLESDDDGFTTTSVEAERPQRADTTLDPLAALGERHLRAEAREIEDEVRRRLAQRGLEPAEGAITGVLREFLPKNGPEPEPGELEAAARFLSDRLLGYGPIGRFLRDPSITEIMINGSSEIYVERDGRVERTSARFASDDDVVYLIERVCSPLGLRADPLSPTVDARLPQGYRFNAVVPPVALDGPVVTIRKYREDISSLDDLVGRGMLDDELAALLIAAVAARSNMLVSGRTASGKTTLLSCLLRLVPTDERIITIEDVSEIRVGNAHVVRMETRPANIEGRGEVQMRQLVRNAMRMRPDRIIIGEVRGEEAFDMLHALSSGQGGSMATLQASSATHAVDRLRSMALMGAPGLTADAAADMVASSVELVVHVDRDADGKRTVEEVIALQPDGSIDVLHRRKGARDKAAARRRPVVRARELRSL
jgi:pilus assembly protein CpaF